MGAIFIRVTKRGNKSEKQKATNNSAVLDWNGRYWCELMVFNIHTSTVH